VVLNIEPDTLFFDLGVRKSKQVEVVSQVDFEFRTGFNFVEPYQMDPKKVTISGPEKVIDTISEVFTENITFSDLSTSFERSVGIVPPNQSVEASEKTVSIKGTVDKITDGTFTIPFEVINLPRDYIISTYPKEVKVVYQVALKDFNKIPENSFRVQCDYRKTEENNLDYLIPQVVEKPEIIFDVKVIPNKIEFLVKK
jgi:YbbR domain-containing protein